MNKELSGVRIRTPARLHFSLIDLNGELGRIDGGIGVAIDRPNWKINITKSSDWHIPDIIGEHINNLKEKMQLTQKYKIEINSILPEHVGLGSQTQLALALARGLAILEGYEYTVDDLAALVGRGGTSGIGVAAFKHGGFILDGGHAQEDKPEFSPSHFSSAKPAVLVNRIKVPDDWYFVVAIPNVGKGKYGDAEAEIFNKHCPIPSSDVEKLSRIILMQILPAVIENDIEHFGKGLNSMQNLGFKSIENQLQPKIVQDLRQFFLERGAIGTGLSSFGPATFAVIKSEDAAHNLVNEANKYLEKSGFSGMVFFTKANNTGVEIEKF